MDVEKTETGLPRGAADALADPIVQTLMAADGVDPRGLEALLRGVAIRIAGPDPSTAIIGSGGSRLGVLPATMPEGA